MQPLRRTLGMLALAVAGSLVLLGAGMPVASAHDALVATTPADGASVPAAPTEVSLGFTGAVQELGAEVVVTGPDGAAATDGDARVDGATVTRPLAPGLSGGTYSVAWRVTSADGHPISGTTTFTVAGGTATTPGPVQEASAARPAGSSSSGPAIAIGAAVVLVLALLLAARQLRSRT
ncbi:hypothetical protein SAMN05660991_03741 [Trujillonella endophytica]|uniref:CopC domain-containing protein n=1 Tax=Trujillonella endophytica TaxID=673521 RepID=A0A1H8VQZ7_9ACTN|nr:hypothetical protein SAMN05660991_03741 [Trujillella endophytica]